MLTIEVKGNAQVPQNDSKILLKRKQQKNPGESEYIVRDNYYLLRNRIRNWLLNCFPNKEDGRTYCSYVPCVRDRSIEFMPLLTLMEIMELASYELKGGENAEIFLRINDPDKLKNIAYAKEYSNAVLREIRRKHTDSRTLMQRFFMVEMTDEERWGFIENYFLGREDELEQYLQKAHGSKNAEV